MFLIKLVTKLCGDKRWYEQNVGQAENEEQAIECCIQKTKELVNANNQYYKYYTYEEFFTMQNVDNPITTSKANSSDLDDLFNDDNFWN